MSEITASIYDGAAPATLIADLEDSTDRKWLHQLNDSGSGSLRIHAQDAVLAANPGILSYGNIVRLALNSIDRFAFIIEARTISPAPPGEEVDRWWTISGRGVLALLEDGVVFTEAPVEGSLARQRAFDFTAIAYDDSSWSAATQISRQDDAAGRHHGYPREWPDPLAYWIWSRAMDGRSR